MYFTIWLVGVFIWSGMAFQTNSTKREQGIQRYITLEEKIVEDTIYLGEKAENISKEIAQLMEYFTFNITRLYQDEAEEYMSMLKQMPQNIHCDALKNTLEMLITHIKKIVEPCYKRAVSLIASIADKANTLREEIMHEISTWTTNVTYNIDHSTPLPILLRDVTESTKKISVNPTIARIQFINMTLERFKIIKWLKETEANVSATLCGVVADSYQEEAGNVLNVLKECLLKGSEIKETTSLDISKRNVTQA